jgi:hypothetical protein
VHFPIGLISISLDPKVTNSRVFKFITFQIIFSTPADQNVLSPSMGVVWFVGAIFIAYSATYLIIYINVSDFIIYQSHLNTCFWLKREGLKRRLPGSQNEQKFMEECRAAAAILKKPESLFKKA